MNHTKRKILDAVNQPGGVRPHNLALELKISAVAVHKHLRALLGEGLIQRRGKPPLVLYVAAPPLTSSIDTLHELESYQEGLDRHYCYFTPTGQELHGATGFAAFLSRTQQDKNPAARAKEYLEIVHQAEKFRGSSKLIDGTPKLVDTFMECFISKVFYSDFYSLPKYGKTKLGQYLLHGKSGQSLKLIERIYLETRLHINGIIKAHNIDSVAYAPHSIPRKISFLKEYRRSLALNLPEIQLLKGFSGDAPIAQKSLSKLSERIENARETIFLKNSSHSFRCTLLIDDALGSGATMNEVGRKLRAACTKPDTYQVFGYVIVGSYKGFEVIKEV